jgi:hypothetical protein
MAAEAVGLPRRLVRPVATETLGQRARRPRYAPLASARGTPMPTLAQGIEHWVHDSGDVMRDEAARAAADQG